MSATSTILLTPRPYANLAGSFILVPLLPSPKPKKVFPAEIWDEVFKCESALPLAYQRVQISTVSKLEKFYTTLYSADQKWDSIRRIPYSAPGRWVQVLDLSNLTFTGHAQALLLDSLLTQLFPLTPLLSHFSINPAFTLSCRALTALGDREGAINLKSLEGISHVPTASLADSLTEEEPIVKLLRNCPALQELEVVGGGLDPSEAEWSFKPTELSVLQSFKPLSLPNLRILTLLSIHSGSLLHALLLSPLPALCKVTITPYDDIPYPSSLVSQFIATHGPNLRSLLLFTPKSWPTRLHPSPRTLLLTCPKLRHLSLEHPLPSLLTTEPHQLQYLSIPRPSSPSWEILVRLLQQLPNLCAVRIRDVRWLRKGMNTRAQEAGVQGEMKEWRRRLARRGVKLLDTDWKDIEV
ncbi:uncharacterized protein EV420DRAFT_1514565 [Desarmillaria tabescens]|uniref:F-box domain-containing protein n=1 Tax=Armillaria tabescens TaxID=1929756 RepID=A0AA39NH05_ARMTA|nr:uncharacterized protein EV420DRAFT_1514565 [Desarmillaria tabescens]KAK0465482.1 hypothetical protein EV420DRAFT_1514565 [Desarmillaria tabescens]